MPVTHSEFKGYHLLGKSIQYLICDNTFQVTSANYKSAKQNLAKEECGFKHVQ